MEVGAGAQVGEGAGGLAELPSVSTLVAENECRHRLVGGPGLDLVVGTVALMTLAALQHVRLRPLQTVAGKVVASDVTGRLHS